MADITILDPFTNKYHAWKDLFSYTGEKLAKHQTASSFKAITIASAILVASVLVGALSFGVGGVALFRTMVGRYVTKLPSGGKVAHAAAVALPTPDQKKLKQILEAKIAQFPRTPNLPKLMQFLTTNSFKYDKKYYDLGYEDAFTVSWLSPTDPADRQFLEKINKKYPAAIQKLQEPDPDIDARNRFVLDGMTRLADNNIFNLFCLAQDKHCPEIQQLLKETLTYCILRDSK